MTVFVYVGNSKPVGDPEHIKVFATADTRHSSAELSGARLLAAFS
jgi:hypothetical protein